MFRFIPVTRLGEESILGITFEFDESQYRYEVPVVCQSIHGQSPYKSVTTKKANRSSQFLVLVTRLELVRMLLRRILSPVRLPIPPHQQMEAPLRFELRHEGFADPGLTAWLWCHLQKTMLLYHKNLTK